MKDLLTQMERMSSTQQFADSLAEPLTWPNKDEPPAVEQSTAGGHFMWELLKAKQGRKVRIFRLPESPESRPWRTQQNKNFVAFAVSKETAGVFASERIRANGWQKP